MFTALDPFEGTAQRPMSLNGYSYVDGDPVNGFVGELTTPVRVYDESRFGVRPTDRHVQSRVVVLTHRPADNLAVEQIRHTDQIKPAIRPPDKVKSVA